MTETSLSTANALQSLQQLKAYISEQIIGQEVLVEIKSELEEELGISKLPKFTLENFKAEEDSKHNADIAIELLDSIIHKKASPKDTIAAAFISDTVTKPVANALVGPTLFSVSAPLR